MTIMQGMVSTMNCNLMSCEGEREGSGSDRERAPGNRCSFWKTSPVTKNDDIAGLGIWLFLSFGRQ